MVFDRVKEILAEELEIPEDRIKMDSDLIDDLGADSLSIVDLVMSVEDEYDLEIPDEEIENMRTVADAVNFIEDNID